MKTRLPKRLLKWFATTIATGVLAVVFFLVLLWLEHNSSLELPKPTGPFAVGRISTVWVDNSRMDPFAPPPARPRELLVWIWYPAKRTGQSKQADYLPSAWLQDDPENDNWLMDNFLWRNPVKIHGHSIQDADMAQDNQMHPVVIFRSGIGALALEYATIVEDLASHGYIVVSADAPYSTTSVVMPDGRVIHRTTEGNPGEATMPAAEMDRLLEALISVWTADTRFLLDQVVRLNESDPLGRLTGRVDLSSVGVAGHSFGGAAAAQCCHDDERFRAGVNIDGALHGSVVRAGIDQPFLFLVSDHGSEWASPVNRICSNIRSASSRAQTDKLIVTLVQAHHFSFSDQALTQSRILRAILVALGGPGGLDARTGLASTTRYIREFFDVQLRGAPREPLYSGPLVPGARFEAK